MRIGLFSDTYLPATNGISYVIEILKKDMEAEGHQVWVFAPRDIRWKLPPEKNIIRYPAIGGIFYKDQFNTFIWPATEVGRVKELNLDAIIAFTPVFVGVFGLYCSKKLSIPYIMQYGTDMESYADLYKSASIAGIIGAIFLAPYLLRMNASETRSFYLGYFGKRNKQSFFGYSARHGMSFIHRHSSAVIATSEKISLKLSQWPIRQNIKVIPTGVDPLPLSEPTTKSFATKHKIKPDDEVILYTGRLSVEKNLGLLIDAFKIVAEHRPKAKLLLVGDFQDRGILRARVDAYADRIIFAGRLDRTELGSIYALADIFTFPSLTDCQALVINEAANAGLPIVWCDNESLNPVLKDGVSGLQAKNDAKDFADKISAILNSVNVKNKLGAGAKAQALKYTEAKQTEKVSQLIQQLIENNRTSVD